MIKKEEINIERKEEIEREETRFDDAFSTHNFFFLFIKVGGSDTDPCPDLKIIHST